MSGRRSILISAFALIVAALVGISVKAGSVDGTAALPTTTTRPSETTTTVGLPGVPPPTKIALAAVANGPSVSVYAKPGDQVVEMKLSNPTIENMPLAMLAVDQQGEWLQVRLPIRPNDTLGWIQASEVHTTPVDNRIVISVSQRDVRVLDKNQQVIYDQPVAVGKPSTPTPLGRFFVDIWLPNPGSPYGAFMLSIAGFSDVLKSFGGGRGQIAMHGWSDPSVVGRNVSNGCIRMRNADIVALSQIAPLGTPVEIVA